MSYTRTKVAGLSISAALLVAIAGHEGFRDKAYLPTPNDVPTIGFGTTQNVKLGDTVTVQRALISLLADTDKFAKAVQRCAPVPMYQHEFDSFVSLTYNIGENAFCRSTLARKLNALDYEGACREILRWNKQAGRVLPGLVKRRQAEYRQCIGGA